MDPWPYHSEFSLLPLFPEPWFTDLWGSRGLVDSKLISGLCPKRCYLDHISDFNFCMSVFCQLSAKNVPRRNTSWIFINWNFTYHWNEYLFEITVYYLFICNLVLFSDYLEYAQWHTLEPFSSFFQRTEEIVLITYKTGEDLNAHKAFQSSLILPPLNLYSAY